MPRTAGRASPDTVLHCVHQNCIALTCCIRPLTPTDLALCAAQANGLNVSRVFLYNLDYGPTSQVPFFAPTPPSAPSVQDSGPKPRGPIVASAPAPVPAPAVLPADSAAADAAAPAGLPPPQAAESPQSNSTLIGGQHLPTCPRESAPCLTHVPDTTACRRDHGLATAAEGLLALVCLRYDSTAGVLHQTWLTTRVQQTSC